MTERKEKTMLKWLKQKPTHGHGGMPIEKITDDPLATIQVHPHAKKSKNKANEIYAVSRVNPLFEEEDGKEVFSPGGNSGSSGYDSGSGPSDDDFPIITNGTDLQDLQANILGRLSSSSDDPSAKHAQLFINTENDVIHHEAAIVGPNGRPVLQILEQNPNYVKSIALSVANGRKRPLSPISESSQQNPLPITNTQIIRTSSNTLSKISPKDAKLNSHSSSNSPIDVVGAAKLVKKDSQYVKSIRIGAPSSSSNTGTKRSILEANRRFSSSSSSSSNGPSRRPSVTFADDVSSGSRSNSRKPSVEQDSIVTESLLMMTSVGGSDARKFSNASNTSTSTTNSRKTSVSSSQSKSQDGNSTETDNLSEKETVDLEAFANSLRKSRPIKQLSSTNASRSPGSSDELDETSSSSSNPSEGYESTEPPHENEATLDRPTNQAANSATNPRMHGSKIHKSPFGGIADHYAAAKEIAKEIESYNNGSAKASTKKSLVRDLLHRGNRNAANSTSSNDISSSSKNATNIIVNGSNVGTNKSKMGFRGSRAGGGRDGTITKDSSRYAINQQLHDPQVVLASRTSPIYYESHGTATAINGNPRANSSTLEAVTTLRSGVNNDWELVRVQQVYVKAGTSYQDQQLHQQQPQLAYKQQKKNSKEGDSSTVTSSDSSGRAAAPQGQDHSGATTNTINSTISGRHPSSSASLSTTPKTSSTSTGGKTAKKEIGDSGMGLSVDHLTVDYYYKNGYHESDRFYRRLSDNSSGISSGYDESASSDTSEGPDITVSNPPTPQPISRADDGLPAGARSRAQRDDDLDSGHSSDRIYTEVRLEIEGTAMALEDEKFTATARQPDDENFEDLDLPSKVMIVTGDSQNIVVDLSGVPLDLKNAIVSGTALITLPEGLDKLLQPGYTMITIPASNRPMSPQPPIHTQLIVDGVSTGEIRNNLSKKDGVMNITIGDDKPLVASGSSSNSEDECKLFSTKNKAQIWDVMQNTLGKHDGGGGGKGKKKITTIFPFHPNQDTYESPDFTIEGHRMDRQRKKVELEKKRRCACRLCGMLFFLVAFLGVLVALSMIYTKGQRYFGSV